jgi:hypothetical protein
LPTVMMCAACTMSVPKSANPPSGHQATSWLTKP